MSGHEFVRRGVGRGDLHPGPLDMSSKSVESKQALGVFGVQTDRVRDHRTPIVLVPLQHWVACDAGIAAGQ